jgi:hypothetical protein
MKLLYLNSILPDLYLDSKLTKQFYLPFNISAVLISIERGKYTPVWVTTALLQITKKESFYDNENINKLSFLTENKIIPDLTLKDFLTWLKISVNTKKEITGSFSKEKNRTDIKESLQFEYDPKFLPLFKKSDTISHILFYLEPLKEDKKFIFCKINKLIENTEKEKNIKKHLFASSQLSIIEINKYLKIESHNDVFLKLFSQKPNYLDSNFLELWTIRNQSKIEEILFTTKQTQEEQELTLFEEFKDNLKKLKLNFKRIHGTQVEEFSILVTIENLNQQHDKDKLLTKKAFLLQSTHQFSLALENDEETFLTEASIQILKNFEFKGLYYIDFNKEITKTIISFPRIREIEITNDLYERHQTFFSNINRNNIKHVFKNNIFRLETDHSFNTNDSTYLLGIPIYEEKKQIGAMIYLCDTKKIEIDSVYQLYSLTTILSKLHRYHTRLKELKLNSV